MNRSGLCNLEAISWTLCHIVGKHATGQKVGRRVSIGGTAQVYQGTWSHT
jgi:hypothetical protein